MVLLAAIFRRICFCESFMTKKEPACKGGFVLLAGKASFTNDAIAMQKQLFYGLPRSYAVILPFFLRQFLIGHQKRRCLLPVILIDAPAPAFPNPLLRPRIVNILCNNLQNIVKLRGKRHIRCISRLRIVYRILTHERYPPFVNSCCCHYIFYIPVRQPAPEYLPILFPAGNGNQNACMVKCD